MTKSSNAILFLLFILLISSCKSKENDDWNDVFEENNINGTFSMKNLNTGEVKIHNKIRSDSLYLPASTFKILNSLIALENSVVKDEIEIIKWDGIDKGYSQWNKDQNMKTAIRVSCVWFYQELARRIGAENMEEAIIKSNYGNQKMGKRIDDFWLKGDIRISSNQQIIFLSKLVENELPFSISNQEKVKEILVTDETDEYIISLKTGWSKHSSPGIGWVVGYIEKDNNNWVFSLNIDINNKSDLKLRKKILYEILKIEKLI